MGERKPQLHLSPTIWLRLTDLVQASANDVLKIVEEMVRPFLMNLTSSGFLRARTFGGIMPRNGTVITCKRSLLKSNSLMDLGAIR